MARQAPDAMSAKLTTLHSMRAAWCDLSALNRKLDDLKNQCNEICCKYSNSTSPELLRVAHKRLCELQSQDNVLVMEYCGLEEDLVFALDGKALLVGDNKILFGDSQGNLEEREILA